MMLKATLLLIALICFTSEVFTQSNYDVFPGRWEGGMKQSGFMSYYWYVTLELRQTRTPGEYSGVLEMRAQQNGRSKNHNITAYFQNGKLSIRKSFISADLDLSNPHGLPEASGAWRANNSGGMLSLRREFSHNEAGEFFKKFGESLLSHPTKLNVQNQPRSYLGSGENGCFSYEFEKQYIPLIKNNKIVLWSSNPNIKVNGAGILEENNLTNNLSALRFSIYTYDDEIDDSITLTSYIYYGSDSLPLAQSKIAIKTNSSGIVKVSKSNANPMEGLWFRGGISYPAIYNFRSDYTYTMNAYSSTQTLSDVGKWNYYTNACNLKQYLLLFDSQNPDGVNPLNSTQSLSYEIASGTPSSGQSMIMGYKPDGKSINLYKIDNVLPEHSHEYQSLQTLMQGKWQSDNSMLLNLKEDHSAVQFNNGFNGSDYGFWFSTYAIESGTLHVYLNVVLMNGVYETNKYEVALDNSNVNKLYIRQTVTPNSPYFSITRNDLLDIPEKISNGKDGPKLNPRITDIISSIPLAKDLFFGVDGNKRKSIDDTFYSKLIQSLQATKK